MDIEPAAPSGWDLGLQNNLMRMLDENFTEIFSFLRPRDLIAFASTCRASREKFLVQPSFLEQYLAGISDYLALNIQGPCSYASFFFLFQSFTI